MWPPPPPTPVVRWCSPGSWLRLQLANASVITTRGTTSFATVDEKLTRVALSLARSSTESVSLSIKVCHTRGAYDLAPERAVEYPKARA
jgi:hypothetical protein